MGIFPPRKKNTWLLGTQEKKGVLLCTKMNRKNSFIYNSLNWK